jgi:hypothetical protein
MITHYNRLRLPLKHLHFSKIKSPYEPHYGLTIITLA